MVNNPPAKAGFARDAGSIPGLGRCLEKEMATHSRILAWKIPWTEEPSRLQPNGVAKSWTQLSAHTHTHTHTHMRVPLKAEFFLP